MSASADAGGTENGRPVMHVMGVAMHIRLTGEDTRGLYSVMEHIFPPGSGPAFLHAHPASESVVIREGTFEFYSKGPKGKETTKGGPSDIFHVLSGGAHGLKNVGETEGRAFVIFHPADLQEKFFFEYDVLLSRSQGTLDPSLRDALFARHGLMLLEEPPA